MHCLGGLRNPFPTVALSVAASQAKSCKLSKEFGIIKRRFKRGLSKRGVFDNNMKIFEDSQDRKVTSRVRLTRNKTSALYV